RLPEASVSRRRTGSGAPPRIVGSRGARHPANGAPRRPRMAARRASAVAGVNGGGAVSSPDGGSTAPRGDAPAGVLATGVLVTEDGVDGGTEGDAASAERCIVSAAEPAPEEALPTTEA